MGSAAAEQPPPGAAAARAAAVSTNGVVFWPVAVAVVLADLVTKAAAEYALRGQLGFPERVIGDAVRFTLVYNPGAAFGLHLGPFSRGIFLALTVLVLRALWEMYKRTRDRDNARTFAIALLCGGAVGNAIDRVRSAHGVVDFLDIGVGAYRWPTFNLADVAVTSGAVLLFTVFWRAEQAAADPSDAASAT